MITLIAAMDEAGGIGYRGRLPAWHAPGDLKRFRKLTTGKKVIMGRRTFEEIGRPLPDRVNICVTGASIPGIICARSLPEAIALVGEDEGCLIGGRRVFEEGLPSCTHAALTLVRGVNHADIHFPVESFNRLAWEVEDRIQERSYDFYLLRRCETTRNPFTLRVR